MAAQSDWILPQDLRNRLEALPKYIDRRDGAGIVSNELFKVSPRSLSRGR